MLRSTRSCCRREEATKEHIKTLTSSLDAATVRAKKAEDSVAEQAEQSAVILRTKAQQLADADAQATAATERCVRAEASSAALEEQLRSSRVQNEALKVRANAEVGRRIKAVEKLLDLQGNIRVFCRVRPVLSREKKQPEAGRAWEPFDPQIDVCTSFPFNNEVAMTRRECAGQPRTVGVHCDKITNVEHYEFDHVFRPESTQEEVAGEIMPIAGSFVRGHDVAILAYGQTGSGKTHTMEGDAATDGGSESGLIPRVVQAVFKRLSSADGLNQTQSESGHPTPDVAGGVDYGKEQSSATSHLYSLFVSAMEIYNEHIFDMLIDRPKNSKRGGPGFISLTVRGTSVVGLNEVEIKSKAEFDSLLERCRNNRAVGTTDMNAHSSRSHLVVQLKLVRNISPVTSVTLIQESSSSSSSYSSLSNNDDQKTQFSTSSPTSAISRRQVSCMVFVSLPFWPPLCVIICYCFANFYLQFLLFATGSLIWQAVSVWSVFD